MHDVLQLGIYGKLLFRAKTEKQTTFDKQKTERMPFFMKNHIYISGCNEQKLFTSPGPFNFILDFVFV